jgi:hypothetical protein
MFDTNERNDFQSQVVKKAWEDENFKQALIKDPHAALKQEFKLSMPDDVEVKVVEETSKVVYLVLPLNPDNLPDDILDKAAGGGCYAGMCGKD